MPPEVEDIIRFNKATVKDVYGKKDVFAHWAYLADILNKDDNVWDKYIYICVCISEHAFP